MVEPDNSLEKQSIVTTDKPAFWITAIGIIVIVLTSVIFQDAAMAGAKSLFGFVTTYCDWVYQYGSLGILIFLIWLAMGRYGKIKMGTAEDKVEFSDWTYRGMIFTCGVGSSLIYWGIAEPIYYLKSAPAPTAAVGEGLVAAAKYAIVYPQWHWGITMWAAYCAPCIVLGYALCVRKASVLRFGNCLKPIIGKTADGWGGTAINVFVTFALITAFGTAFGTLVPLLAEICNTALGLPDNNITRGVILLIFLAQTGLCLYTGLEKGFTWLSNVTVWLTLGITGYVLIVGPTDFIIDYSLDSVGLYFSDYLRMNTWLDPIAKSGHPQNWDVFYWAWVFALIGLTGPFVARISRGRSLREIILSMLFWGSAGVSVVMMIFGAYTVHMQLFGGVDLLAIQGSQGMSIAITKVFMTLPAGKAFMILYFIIQIGLMGTTINSACYNSALMTSKGVTAYNNPGKHNQMFWCLMLMGIGLASVMLPDLEAIKNWVVPNGIPGFIITVGMLYSLVVWIREDVGTSLDPAPPFSVTPSKKGV